MPSPGAWRCVARGIAAVVAALLPVTAAEANGPVALRAGETVALTVRWIVEDGYYLDEATPSSLSFVPPEGVAIDPATIETEGRVVGIAEQQARLSVAAGAKAGRRAVRGDLVLFFCSSREQWCRRLTRQVALAIEVVAERAGPPGPVEIEVIVPLDDER